MSRLLPSLSGWILPITCFQTPLCSDQPPRTRPSALQTPQGQLTLETGGSGSLPATSLAGCPLWSCPQPCPLRLESESAPFCPPFCHQKELKKQKQSISGICQDPHRTGKFWDKTKVNTSIRLHATNAALTCDCSARAGAQAPSVHLFPIRRQPATLTREQRSSRSMWQR